MAKAQGWRGAEVHVPLTGRISRSAMHGAGRGLSNAQ